MMELKLHSPAGAEPVLYTWPLTSGRGNVRTDIVILKKLYEQWKSKIDLKHLPFLQIPNTIYVITFRLAFLENFVLVNKFY
ncbi:unnamed protein product [Callosobruchus maculatus]|uniref:Uncharacterized protein n=1 Tax=Callosobruchus maculatus TaxID=64391 RepID=A0A653CZ30_CALMS|nr:unnamed protein product [Callosobruchus maculatus]